MSQGGSAVGTSVKWDFAEGMELEKQEKRKTPGGASSPERAVVLLYVLLALTFVVFTALTIVNLRRVSAAWEALEQARMQSESSHTTAWHNLSEVQLALDKQLSGGIKGIHSQILNVSQEMENVQRKVTQCKAECGKELSDRLRTLEQRDVLGPVQQQLAEVKQAQSRASALLNTALEQIQGLSDILCLKCPAGWEQFAKTCYYFSSNTKTWLGAKEFCANYNAHLAVVNSEQENKFLANHVMDNWVFWLGLTDMHTEGSWQWVDSRSVSMSFWNTGEPNNAGQHGEDCASIYANGRWNDVICSNSERWICERSC